MGRSRGQTCVAYRGGAGRWYLWSGRQLRRQRTLILWRWRQVSALREIAMYKSILVAIDGSDAANRGLSQAIELAKHLGGRIRVINVVNKMPLVSPGTPAEVMYWLVDELRGNAESLVHEAVTRRAPLASTLIVASSSRSVIVRVNTSLTRHGPALLRS